MTNESRNIFAWIRWGHEGIALPPLPPSLSVHGNLQCSIFRAMAHGLVFEREKQRMPSYQKKKVVIVPRDITIIGASSIYTAQARWCARPVHGINFAAHNFHEYRRNKSCLSLGLFVRSPRIVNWLSQNTVKRFSRKKKKSLHIIKTHNTYTYITLAKVAFICPCYQTLYTRTDDINSICYYKINPTIYLACKHFFFLLLKMIKKKKKRCCWPENPRILASTKEYRFPGAPKEPSPTPLQRTKRFTCSSKFSLWTNWRILRNSLR